MKRIYIAGRLNDLAPQYIQNVHNMIKIADEIRRMGFAVFVPCLGLLMGIVSGNYKYEDYAENSISWLEVSDALFVLPDSENSQGTQQEIARAKELGLPIFMDKESLWRTLKDG